MKAKMKRIIVTAIVLAAVTGCAGLAPRGDIRGSAYRSASYSGARVYSNWSAAAMAMLRASAGAPELSRDESVGITGVLGQTVNEVVPIPGTDMIRVGALQEGSFFQTSFRNASQEAATRGGAVAGAVIIFKVFRP